MNIGRASQFPYGYAGEPGTFPNQRQDSHQPFTCAGGHQNNLAFGFESLEVGRDPFRAMEGHAPCFLAKSSPSRRQVFHKIQSAISALAVTLLKWVLGCRIGT